MVSVPMRSFLLNTNSGSEHCSVFSHVMFSCFNTSPNGSKWL